MVTIKDLYSCPSDYIGKEIQVSGWVRSARSSKTVGFIAINDGTYFKTLQVVIGDALPNFEEISKIGLSSALRISGTLVESIGAKQPFELQAKEVFVEGDSEKDYPLQKKRHTLEYLRTIPHLRPRSNTFNAVFRVRSLLSFALHQFFNENGFVYVHTPIITASDAEGAGEMFLASTIDPQNPPLGDDGKVDYREDFFGSKTHLTVSGQLEVEAFAMAFRNVYTFGPTFRAENSNTPRHAAEFWMVEPEMAFAELKDIMDLGEKMMKYVIDYLLVHAPEEMEFFNNYIDKGLIDRLTAVRDSKFEHMTYTKAIEHLENADVEFKYPVKWGYDLQTEHERYISEVVVKGPVYITDYPKEIKSFYMRVNEDGKTVAATDLLVPGIGELIGGSQREERLDVLISLMEEKGLNPEDYEWYMELRRFGGTKHAGFGLGFERCLMYVTGITNIRDVLPYPRTVNSLHE